MLRKKIIIPSWITKTENTTNIDKIKETFKNPKQGDAERYKYVQEIKEKRKNYLDKMRKLRKEKAPQEKIVPKTQKVNKGGKKH